MHIGIDGRMITWSGIGRYTQNLLQNIVRLDEVNKYTIFCHPEDRDSIPTGKNFFFTEVRSPVFSLTGQKTWEKILRSADLDLFYTPYIIVPFKIPCRSVGTIHDLIPWRMPEVQQSLIARLFYRQIIRQAADAKWDYILVDSDFTRKDVVNFLGVSEERIRTVPAAADESFRPISDQEKTREVLAGYGIEGKFILNVGTARPHKNLPFLIEVFGVLARERKVDCQLVFAGAEDKWRPAHRRMVAAMGLQKKIIFTGHVAGSGLPALYSQASLCVFPSLFEGFGLPALEAMACGCPVACSNGSSLDEVVGEAGLLLDPRQPAVWVEAIEKVLSDERLRESMATKGLEKAKQFSWKKTTRSILEVFEELGMSTELRA